MYTVPTTMGIEAAKMDLELPRLFIPSLIVSTLAALFTANIHARNGMLNERLGCFYSLRFSPDDSIYYRDKDKDRYCQNDVYKTLS